MEKVFFCHGSLDEGQTILKPSKYMRSPPSLLSKNLPKSVRNSPESMTYYLRRLIKKQCRINSKVYNILGSSPPSFNEAATRIPIKTSRLSPYVFKNIQLKPLPSQTPPPRVIKKSIQVKEKPQDERIGVLAISTKQLTERFEQKFKNKKTEIGTGTREEPFGEVDEDLDDEDLDNYFSYKACLS